MHCVVTAGPTYEPLDQVRRLTNYSTGRLGAELAAMLAARGHRVTLLLGEMATHRPHADKHRRVRFEAFTTTTSLRQRLQALAGEPVEAVFHAAAVSDFAFGRVWRRSPRGKLAAVRSGKISSREGPLLAELVPTPKIISHLRAWFPRARLVGWKFEVNGSRAGAIRAAERLMTESQIDACVVNGPAYGKGFGLARPGQKVAHLACAKELCRALERFIC